MAEVKEMIDIKAKDIAKQERELKRKEKAFEFEKKQWLKKIDQEY